MKKRLVFMVFTLLVTLAMPGTAFAAQGTVRISVKTAGGMAMQGAQITCTDQSSAGGMPTPPVFTYLTTDVNGIATWTVDAPVSDHTYKCTPRTSYTPDTSSCYYMVISSKTFNFVTTPSDTFVVTAQKDTAKCPDAPAATTPPPATTATQAPTTAVVPPASQGTVPTPAAADSTKADTNTVKPPVDKGTDNDSKKRKSIESRSNGSEVAIYGASALFTFVLIALLWHPILRKWLTVLKARIHH